MGHQTSKIPFVLLMHHFLKQYGVNLPEEQLTNCYQTVVEYNPWFPEEGTLDLQTQTRVKNNVLKAYRQGVKIPPQWSLLWAVMEQLDGSGGNLKVETVRSLHECELEEKDLSEVLNQKNVTLEQITDKQELQVLKAIKQSTLPEAPDPPLPCFLRAHINQPLTTAATLSAAATAPLFPSIPPRDMPLCAWAFPVQLNNPQPRHNQ